jgi:hypothetical protein
MLSRELPRVEPLPVSGRLDRITYVMGATAEAGGGSA